MAIITLAEIFNMLVIAGALGYIFSSFLPRELLHKKSAFELMYNKNALNWESLKYAAIITGPAVILHELAHKFVALAIGLKAELFASYWGLGLGIFLKMIGSPLVFFIPGYVAIQPTGMINPQLFTLQSGIVAFAGPAMNALIWLVAGYLIKNRKWKKREMIILILTKKINGFLFIFNMIPFGMFDGAKVFSALGLLLSTIA